MEDSGHGLSVSVQPDGRFHGAFESAFFDEASAVRYFQHVAPILVSGSYSMRLQPSCWMTSQRGWH